MKRLRIGIDAGASGGIAWMMEEGQVHFEKIARMSKPLEEQARRICSQSLKVVVYLETVTVFTGGKASPFAIQKLRDQWNHLRIYFAQQGATIVDVTPSQWQRAHHLISKHKEKPTDKKNRHKELAATFFASEKMTHWKADAGLILIWGINERPDG